MLEKQPKFLKDFSKEQDAQGRQDIAREIKNKRREPLEREAIIEITLQQVNEISEKIASLSDNGVKRFWNYLEIKRLQAEKVLGEKKYNELLEDKERVRLKYDDLFYDQEDQEQRVPEMEQAKAMLNSFYEKQAKQWEEADYSPEDIQRYFTEEHLASLSLSDYELLMRRFPNEMVTHVTRQGFRDHTGHMFHTKGLGEYANGFKEMVADGKLRSPLGVHLIQEEKDRAIERLLHLELYKTEEEALQALDNFLDISQQSNGGSYADRSAIHFAAEEVADAYYGSEKGNEIFIAYPSVFITSQYYFKGRPYQRGGDYHNDLWVWSKEERGLDLNAGIVFIPAEARVDRNSGSRYATDEEGRLQENSAYIEAALGFVSSEGFREFAKEIIYDYKSRSWLFLYSQSEKEQRLEAYRDRLKNEFGITDERLQSVFLDVGFLNGIFATVKVNKDKEGEKNVKQALQEVGMLYMEAQETISSKEYWETYFEANPEKKPSKIVYYEGSSPTQALGQLRKGFKKSSKKDAENSERMVMTDSYHATQGTERFRVLAEDVIRKYYARRLSEKTKE